jgi:HAD superfamily hydrolase (TIGR01509 family)
MLKALFFDLDGVIADTERYGHLVAFNRAFAEFSLGFFWDDETYHRLLQTGGGKERLAVYLSEINFARAEYQDDPSGFIKAVHARKTELFRELVSSGSIPLRPGIRRLMGEARAAGKKLAVCTTSQEASARSILTALLPQVPVDLLIAGDMVRRKKPDPEIYLTALEKTGIAADEAVVLEDSSIGVSAAVSAGIRVIATVSSYTAEEDLSAAAVTVDSLGEPGGPPARLIRGHAAVPFYGFIDLSYIEQLLH